MGGNKHNKHVIVDDSQLSTASTLNGSVCGTCTTVSSPGSGDDRDDETVQVSTKENVNIDIDMKEDKKDENDEENDIVPIVLWKIDERLASAPGKNFSKTGTITNNTSLSKLERLRARTKILRKQGKQIIAETRDSIRKNRAGLVVSDDRDPIAPPPATAIVTASDDARTDFPLSPPPTNRNTITPPPRIIESSTLSILSRYSPSLSPPPPMSPPSPLRVSSSLLQPPDVVVRPGTTIEEGSSSAVAEVAAASHRRHHRRLRKQQQPSSPCFSMYNKDQKCQKLEVENDCLKRQLNLLESRNRDTERKLTKKLRHQNKKISEEDNDDDDVVVDNDNDDDVEEIASSLMNDSNKEDEGRHHRLTHHRHQRKNTPSKGSLSYRRKRRKKKRHKVVMVCIVAPLFVSLTLWFYQSVRNTPSSSSYYMNTSNIIENTTTTAAINTKNVEDDGSFSILIGNMSSILVGDDNENNINIGSVLTSTTSASTTMPIRDNLALVMREGILRQILFHDNKSYDMKNDNSQGSNVDSNDDVDDDTDNNSNNSNGLLFMNENDYCPAIKQYQIQQSHDSAYSTSREDGNNTNDSNDKEAVGLGFQRKNNKSNRLKQILSNLGIRNTINNGIKQLRIGSFVQYKIQQSNISSASREDGNNNNDRNDEEAVGSNFQRNDNKKGNRSKRMLSNLRIRSRIDNGLKRILKRIKIRQDHNTLGVWLKNRNDEEAAELDFQRNNNNKKANRMKRILSDLRIRSRIDNGLKQILNKRRIHQDHNTLEIWLKKRIKRLKRIVVKETTVSNGLVFR